MTKNGLYDGKAQDNRRPRESQQLFRPNPSGVGERTTTLRRLLMVEAIFQLAHLNKLLYRVEMMTLVYLRVENELVQCYSNAGTRTSAGTRALGCRYAVN